MVDEPQNARMKKELKPDASYQKSVGCINSFFSALFAIEKKYGQRPFNWVELEQRYQKQFKEKLAIDSISSVLVRFFGGEQESDARSFVRNQLSSILLQISVTEIQGTSPHNNLLLQYLKELPMGEKEVTTSPHERIAVAYEAFKRFPCYLLEQWKERETPPIQAPPPVADAPPCVLTTSVVKQEDDLSEPTRGVPSNETPQERALIQANREENANDESLITHYLQSFFTVLLELEKTFGQEKFFWKDMKKMHQKLLNKKLTLDKLVQTFRIRVDVSRPLSIRHCLKFPLDNVILLTKKHDVNPSMRFRTKIISEKILIRASGEPLSRSFVASQYAAFKTSRGFSAQTEEKLAPPPPDTLPPPPPLVLQVLFATIFAVERQFGEAEFTWNDMVEMHQQLCGENLTVQLLERVLGGIKHGRPTLRAILGQPLFHIFRLMDDNKENPRMRFIHTKPLEIIAQKSIEWVPGEQMPPNFVLWHYAVFKQSQGFVAGQNENKQAPPLLEAPPSIGSNPHDQGSSPGQILLRKRKEKVDADELKIKKEKTEDDEGLKVKEEPIDVLEI